MVKFRRRVLGLLIVLVRGLGWVLVALAILSFPAIRGVVGSWEAHLSTISSAALLLAGIVWLIVVEAFLRFFDDFLSRF